MADFDLLDEPEEEIDPIDRGLNMAREHQRIIGPYLSALRRNESGIIGTGDLWRALAPELAKHNRIVGDMLHDVGVASQAAAPYPLDADAYPPGEWQYLCDGVKAWRPKGIGPCDMAGEHIAAHQIQNGVSYTISADRIASERDEELPLVITEDELRATITRMFGDETNPPPPPPAPAVGRIVTAAEMGRRLGVVIDDLESAGVIRTTTGSTADSSAIGFYGESGDDWLSEAQDDESPAIRAELPMIRARAEAVLAVSISKDQSGQVAHSLAGDVLLLVDALAEALAERG